MTDTEAKALALVNEVFMERCLNPDTYINRVKNSYHEAICRAIERLEATEARHAAELREQAERFSEAASLTLRMLTPYLLAKDEAEDILTPFILPAPDPLVEVMDEMGLGQSKTASKEFLAAIEKRGGRIVWGDGGMDAATVQKAEWLWTQLPILTRWHAQPTYVKAIVCRAIRKIEADAQAAIAAMQPAPQWQGIESAPPPPNTRVLIAWRDWRDGKWLIEAAPYETGERVGPYSNVSRHGSATHWMPLPTPPAGGSYAE